MGALVSVNVSVCDHVLRLWEREWCIVFSVVMCGYCSGCLGSENVLVRSSVLRFWVLIVR